MSWLSLPHSSCCTHYRHIDMYRHTHTQAHTHRPACTEQLLPGGHTHAYADMLWLAPSCLLGMPPLLQEALASHPWLSLGPPGPPTGFWASLYHRPGHPVWSVFTPRSLSLGARMLGSAIHPAQSPVFGWAVTQGLLTPLLRVWGVAGNGLLHLGLCPWPWEPS